MEALEFGEYSLPEDCVVQRKGTTIILRPNRKIRVNEHRCRNCKHFGIGATSTAIYYPKRICLLKPKTEYKGEQIYFAANAYDKICDKFELKTE